MRRTNTTLKTNHTAASPNADVYEQRAGSDARGFDDPWFDGANSDCTIVATPNRRTTIGVPRSAADLSDDHVAAIAYRELERAIYQPGVSIVDEAARLGAERVPFERGDPYEELAPVAGGHFGFAHASLADDVRVTDAVATTIGTTLWHLLDPRDRIVPSDSVLMNHIYYDGELVALWSQRGIAVAAKVSAHDTVKEMREVFARFASVARQLDELVEPHGPESGLVDRVRRGDELLRVMAREAHVRATPEGIVLSRFGDAVGLREVLDALRDVNRAQAQQLAAEKLDRQTDRVTESAEIIAEVQTQGRMARTSFRRHLRDGSRLEDFRTHRARSMAIRLHAHRGVRPYVRRRTVSQAVDTHDRRRSAGSCTASARCSCSASAQASSKASVFAAAGRPGHGRRAEFRKWFASKIRARTSCAEEVINFVIKCRAPNKGD